MQINLRHYASVTSTMDVCRELAVAGADEGTMIVADQQTAGRGQHQRVWHSPPEGNLYASLLLRPQCHPQHLGLVTMIGAIALVDAVHALAPFVSGLGIKWFNDVYIDNRKLAGVLTECACTGDKVDYAIVGFGLNLNCDFNRAPEALRTIALSLKSITGAHYELMHAVEAVVESVQPLCAALNGNERQVIVERFRALSVTLGHDVTVARDGVSYFGRALHIRDDGALVLAQPDGGTHVLPA